MLGVAEGLAIGKEEGLLLEVAGGFVLGLEDDLDNTKGFEAQLIVKA